MEKLFEYLADRSSDTETLQNIQRHLNNNISINVCSKHTSSPKTGFSYGQSPAKTVDTVAMTPLQYAMSKGKWLCVQFLLQQEIRALAVFPIEFNTPLHEIACCDNNDFLVWFWDNPAILSFIQQMNSEQINCQNEEGLTPLMLAIKTQKNLERITIWGKFGNDYDATDDKGRTMVHIAIEAKHTELVPMLVTRNARLATIPTEVGAYPMHMAAMTSSLVVMQVLFDAGASVESKDKDFSSPLHWAAKFGYTDAMRFLLQHGARVNAMNSDKDTAMHVVLKNHNTYVSNREEKKLQDALTLLLEFGADFLLKNRKNSDAWDLAGEHLETSEAKKLEFYWAVENHAQRKPSDQNVTSVVNYLKEQASAKLDQNTQNGFSACLDHLSPTQPQQPQVSRYWSQPAQSSSANLFSLQNNK